MPDEKFVQSKTVTRAHASVQAEVEQELKICDPDPEQIKAALEKNEVKDETASSE
jgi:hypothetical protein